MKFVTKYSFAVVALTATVGLTAIPAQAEDFVEGRDYRVLDNPETINGDHIIVREFFWYGCPHCYSLDPYMMEWARNDKPEDVVFLTTPATMRPAWEQSARGFYAAQLMGYQDQTHEALFDAIHEQGQELFDQQSLANWYGSQGLDQDKFNSLYNSFAVDTKIARSTAGAQRYRLTGVPAVVVQGKYVVQAEPQRVPQIVNYLVNKVRAEQ